MKKSKILILMLLTLGVHCLIAQHLQVDNPTLSQLASFNGGNQMFLQMNELGMFRGYIGSYSGNPEDVDFGTNGSNPAGKVHLTIRASPAVTLSDQRNFGIGTTNPTEKLHVMGNIRIQDDADIFGLDRLVGYNDLRLYGNSADGPDIYIAPNGMVGIGTTNPMQYLHVDPGTMMLGDLLFFATPISFRMWGNLEPQDSSPTFHNRDLGHIDHWWDDVYALNFRGPSDRRWKNDVQDLTYGLESVLHLRPVSYKWKHKETGERHCGLIAQEVLDIIPEIVSNSSGEDLDNDESRLTLAYLELIPVLIKAIQEQNAEIEDLKKRVASMDEALRRVRPQK